ncbi:ZirU family protein [Citrobacter braakii]|uniref:ZirU family protein n=1 Tax=Citrobacter braakii TaxID=57706 RepID=UPI002B25469F|nr:ZirU family protein [Citrobacter braakii]MEB2307513.1 ZirU family protein [Citrobacter braakii]
MIKKTLLAVTISATFFSLEASANNNARANSATSATTLASVGHRPVATPDGEKDLEVSGKLITGETLTINKFFITDVDGDGEGAGGKEANLAKTLDGTPGSSGVPAVSGVKWELVKDGNTTALTANADKSLTIPAEAAGGKIRVTYTVHTATGKPDVANQSTSIILTLANSGVTEGGADGTISARLAGVTIKVNGTPTDELNGITTAGTPIVGSTMEAELTCAVESDCADPETKYDFQWQMDDAVNPTGFTDINHVDYPDARSMTYQVRSNQQNKLFQVVVTPQTTKAKRR